MGVITPRLLTRFISHIWASPTRGRRFGPYLLVKNEKLYNNKVVFNYFRNRYDFKHFFKGLFSRHAITKKPQNDGNFDDMQ